MIKITKSARFRKQFRRHDDEEEQDGEETDQEGLLQQRNIQNSMPGKCTEMYILYKRQFRYLLAQFIVDGSSGMVKFLTIIFVYYYCLK